MPRLKRARVGKLLKILGGAFLLRFAWCLRRALTTSLEGSTSRQLQLKLVIVSDRVPALVLSSWLLETVVLSFVSSFRLDETPNLWLDLALYAQCSGQLKTEASDAYELNVVRAIKPFQRYFKDVELLCSDLLPQAVCQSGRTLDLERTDFVFLLEHDWFLLPSEMPTNLAELTNSMLSRGINAVFLQRGDRSRGPYITRSPPLRAFNQYSNNPFLMSAHTFKQLSQEPEICDVQFDLSWEGRVESHFKRMGNRFALLEPVNGRIAMYHMDGRHILYAFAHDLGPYFSRHPRRLQSQGTYEANVSHYAQAVDSVCSSFHMIDFCSPYHIREQMLDSLLGFIRTNELWCHDVEDILLLYFGSAHNVKMQGGDDRYIKIKLEGEIRAPCSYRASNKRTVR